MVTTLQELLWHGLRCPQERPEKTVQEDACFLCGKYRGTIRKDDTISSGFTNWDRCMALESKAVCLYCYTAIKEARLRKSSWLCTPEELTFLKREDIAAQLFVAHPAPFAFYATTSFKKIGQIKAVLNHDPACYTVQFEEHPAQVCPGSDRVLWDTMTRMYSIPVDEQDKKQPKSFFTKDEIRTGNYQPHRIREYGIGEWREDEAVLAQNRGTPTMELFLYALNKESLGRARKEKKADGKRKAKAERSGTDRGRNNLCGLARDRMGQYLLFETDEDI